MDPSQPAPVPAEPIAAPNPKQQIVERVRSGKNVLVTVGTSPSVDELAAALGFTFMLGKLEKHATAVFSGNIPSAMSFLDPESTFENTVDSLRDFIIALDKDKADKLRYKLEDDVVKIFITPYRSVLTKEDFSFSQGDLNVDVVVAVGVKRQEDLDKAITSHGKILHDAAVISINAGEQAGDIGSINWNDPAASSVSEMLVSISEAFGSGLLDEQISTAFLTGIVAETNRFSNEKTSPKVMTMAAQLMAAGANQQLIASNLRQEGMISEPIHKKEEKQRRDDGEMVLSHGSKQPKGEKKKQKPQGQARPVPGNKQQRETAKPTASQPDKPLAPPPPIPPQQNQAPVKPGPAPQPVAPAAPPMAPSPAIHAETVPKPADKPNFTATLNATTTAAEEDQRKQAEREAGSNNITLEHGQGEDAVEAARKAVEDAAAAQPEPVALPPQPAPSPAPETLPAISHDFSQQPDANVSQRQNVPQPVAAATNAPAATPVDDFMQAHATANQPSALSANESTEPFTAANNATQPTPGMVPSPPVAASSMPPLPPLPNVPDGALPPLPPLPGQPAAPQPTLQPQLNPSFMQNMPQSQNAWTEAGQALADKRTQEQADRQAKMNQMTADYDQAVKRNDPLTRQNSTDDHSTFPLPQ